jgi:hypothetical protein
LPHETGFDKQKYPDVISSLSSCLQFSFAEEARGKMRKKWLSELADVAASAASVTDPIPAITKAFSIISEDNRLYGQPGLVVSASVAVGSGNGTELTALKFIAATDNDAEAVVGKTLTWTDPGVICFSAVNEGKPIHVKSILAHGGVTLFKNKTLTEVRDRLF